jgi:hypothetical protein
MLKLPFRKRNKNKYSLDSIPKSQIALAKALRRLRSDYRGYPIRIKDDTGTEQDIPFCGENLCTGTMLNWLQRNQVASIPLGTDANADGVSDGWTLSSETGITGTASINNSYQKLEVTASTTTNKMYVLKDVTCIAGNIVSSDVSLYVSGNVRARVEFAYFNGSTYLSSSSTESTSTSPVTISLSNRTVPATATKVRVLYAAKVGTIGDTGSAYFKDASATISNQSAYVTTWYDQSGNGNHAVQTTAANQPRIVNAGAVVTDNGKPAIETILANDTHFVVPDANTLDFTTNASFSFIFNPANAGENNAGRIVDKASAYILALQTNASYTTGGSMSSASSDASAYVFNSQNINTVTYNNGASEIKYYSKGILNSTKTTNLMSAQTTSLYIMNNSTLTRQYDGKISELILFNTTLTDTQRTKQEKNQGKYYSQTVS